VEHSATLVEEDRGRKGDGLYYHYVQVRADPPGTTLSMFNESPSPQIGYGRLTFSDEDGTERWVSFWLNSVLGSLRKICKQLVKAHPWDVDEAAWFVLTGEAPWVPPISARINHSGVLGSSVGYSTISLTFQPCVPADTVESVCRQAQRRVLDGDNQRIREKNLKLLRFVTERADAKGNLPAGRALVEEWDKKWSNKRPDWCYGSDTRTFWRDFRRAERIVTNSRSAGLIRQ
jgi:hypothetical protein